MKLAIIFSIFAAYCWADYGKPLFLTLSHTQGRMQGIKGCKLLEERKNITIHHLSVFNVTIESTAYCPKFPQPKNGQLECNHMVGRFCSVECNAGFTPQYTPAQGYYCDQASGRWLSYPETDQLPWPDCVPRTELR